MAVFKCKMCGGELTVNDGGNIAVCDFCGTKQTIPRLDDDRRANMYDRAGHFRLANDYDRAMNIYNDILNEDPTDAEAYWSLVLCKFGVEYVKDPATGRMVPTCNRTQNTSVFADEDYKAAIENAASYARGIYEAEAAEIDAIQKGILAISSSQEPFDVFICYKESDELGRRTKESVLAQDIYYQLTEKGLRVFFSRITLEDKLGTEYEPYIFAALSSAKVMVLVTTSEKNANAVWVKNEWSRFLSIMKQDRSKLLIPAYKDMDPYDLPEEFSHLQALDMSKLGFVQDLVHGIEKVTLGASAKAPAQGASASVNSLIERAKICLEDRDFEKAGALANQVLDIDPKNADAYLVLFCVGRTITVPEDCPAMKAPLNTIPEFNRAMQFGDDAIKARLGELSNRVNDGIVREVSTVLQQQAQNKEKKRDAAVREADKQKYIDELKGQLASIYQRLTQVPKKESVYSDNKFPVVSCIFTAVSLIGLIAGLSSGSWGYVFIAPLLGFGIAFLVKLIRFLVINKKQEVNRSIDAKAEKIRNEYDAVNQRLNAANEELQQIHKEQSSIESDSRVLANRLSSFTLPQGEGSEQHEEVFKADASAEPHVCGMCGTWIEASASFCPVCGTKVG